MTRPSRRLIGELQEAADSLDEKHRTLSTAQIVMVLELTEAAGYEIVERVKSDTVVRGDIVWAPHDGDWLTVARTEIDGFGGVVVYRADSSQAEFRTGRHVLRRASA